MNNERTLKIVYDYLNFSLYDAHNRIWGHSKTIL